MAAPSTTDVYIDFVRKSELLAPARVDEFLDRHRTTGELETPLQVAQAMVVDGLLTKYQAEQLLAGRWRNFIVGGKYKLLERLGKGGMAMVFLCEHQVMKRLVALKILPTAHGEDRELLGRFHREARALSQLRHPNIVGAYDVDQAGKTHFLVMEYVDGGDLEQIVRRTGPLAYERAAHYIRQAAFGLQHAHESGLVHRDIKPGNVLVDRAGAVKLLDLGLARIFHETTDDLTTGRDAALLLGTVDYLAPEQAINSHDVDIRADIYGLGATFYFLLMGKGMFEDGTVTQKLSWHLHRPPIAIGDTRPDVPFPLIQVIEKMLAKKPGDRYQTPEEVVDALEPFTRTPIAPPTPDELPRLSRAARNAGPPSTIQRISPTSKSTLQPAPRSPTNTSNPTLRMQPDREPFAPLPPTERIEERPLSTPTLPLAPTLSDMPPASKPRPGRGRWARVKLALAAGAILALASTAAGVWWWATGQGDDGSSLGDRAVVRKPDRPSKPAPPKADAGNAAVPADRPADATIELVNGSEPARSFPNLREAVAAAKDGGRIEIKGRLLRDVVELSEVEHAPRDLTIEGVGPGGAPVRWRAPRDLSQGRALVDVTGIEGLHLKGFLLDGQGKVAELVRLSGRGAGTSLENLQMRGAVRADVVLRAWSGEPGSPASLSGVQFDTDDEAEAAILFDADPDRPTLANREIRVDRCRFVGPYQAGLMIAGAVEGLEVDRCRFYKGTDGLRYRRTRSREPVRVKLANNVFADLQRGFHFETTPRGDLTDITSTNNLFAGTQRICTLDRVTVQPRQQAGQWIWTDEGKKNPSVPAGERFFRKSFDLASVPGQATLDIGCDESFTVWINGIEVGKSPPGHFTQRVYAFEVAGKLRRGRNVIAVKGENRLDRLNPRFGTSAALLVQLTARVEGRDTPLTRSDDTWRFAQDVSESWTQPDYDDKSWATARAWPEGGASWPWMYSVWDSAINAQIKPPLEPIRSVGSGNVRDYKSWEGYPTVDAERVVVDDNAFSRDPANDATFLRLRRDNPLAQAGPGGSPVGVVAEE